MENWKGENGLKGERGAPGEFQSHSSELNESSLIYFTITVYWYIDSPSSPSSSSFRIRKKGPPGITSSYSDPQNSTSCGCDKGERGERGLRGKKGKQGVAWQCWKVIKCEIFMRNFLLLASWATRSDRRHRRTWLSGKLNPNSRLISHLTSCRFTNNFQLSFSICFTTMLLKFH